MKTISRSIMLAAVFATIAFTSNAQIRVYVGARPVEPVIVRPAAPYHDAVWIGGEYEWRGGRYEYIRPHYEHLRRGHVWVGGHWQDVHGGSTWVAGHWR